MYMYMYISMPHYIRIVCAAPERGTDFSTEKSVNGASKHLHALGLEAYNYRLQQLLFFSFRIL